MRRWFFSPSLLFTPSFICSKVVSKSESVKFESFQKYKSPHQMTTHPWWKFWIGIQSDLIKDIPKSVSGPFRINPKNLLNLVRCESVENQSDLLSFYSKLQSEWIRVEFSIRGRNDSDWKYDWMNSNWKFGRIHSDRRLRLNLIESNWFATDMYKTRLHTFFILMRNG